MKIASAIGYFESTNDQGDTLVRARGGKEASAVQAGLYLQHVPTGLFVYGAYAKDLDDRTGGLNAGGAQQKDGDNYYLKAGLRQRWNSLGHSVFYGEYGVNNDKLSNSAWVIGATGSELTQYGVGFVQEIDVAAMSLFMNYRRYEAETTFNIGGLGGKIEFEDAQLFKAGALINF